MKNRKKTGFMALLMFSLFGMFCSAFFTLAAFIKFQESKELTYGTIGLRSYFHCGSGTEEDPFVITRPNHLYNLSRLQALGIFDEKKYFQLGYHFDDGRFGFYKGNSSDEYSPVLDMEGLRIPSIGSEATPFYGVFEGSGLTISNLTVEASLEDSGMFGYVAPGASIRDFALDNIEIRNDGYSSSYSTFYSSDAEKMMKMNIPFKVGFKDGSSVTYSYEMKNSALVSKADSSGTVQMSGTTASFVLTPTDAELPRIEILNNLTSDSDYSKYNYSMNASDVFFDMDEKGAMTLNPKQDSSSGLRDIFSFFSSLENNPEVDLNYPLTLSMTVSSVSKRLDEEGINHSKVISSLNVVFEKTKREDEKITMYVQPREIQHGNNIGLVIGHLDGSLSNVFVHNGTFSLNGNTLNTSVDQKSMTGFIGLIGPSVEDKASENVKGGSAISGKDVGVLDFTEIYDSIVNSGFSEVPDQSYYSYTAKTPEEGNEYFDYLRYSGNQGKNSTLKTTGAVNTIALVGKTVIQDDDTHNRGLGVFTIATDYSTTGVNDQVGKEINKSRIVKSKVDLTGKAVNNDATHVFYSTFEYKKENLNRYPYESVSNVLGSIANPINNGYYVSSRCISPGYYLPSSSSVDSQDAYESYYNYLFRLRLDSQRSGFYFSDLNDNSIGGSFLSHYLRYKLVDENGNSIGKESNQFGLMIKDKKRQNISCLTTTFPLDMQSNENMYVFNEDTSQPSSGKILTNQTSYAVGNSINFEIKTEYANVTILASNSESNHDFYGSVLGIYRLPNYLKIPSGQSSYVPCDTNGNQKTWNDPDYAMALSPNKALSFFSYDSQTGTIGKGSLDDDSVHALSSSSDGSFSLAEDSNRNEKIQEPIFAHTFKLPKGRYCLGSAAGKASVYYICAQGQDDGDISLSANVFNSQNRVENIDFVKSLDNVFSKDNLGNVVMNEAIQRCYLIFDSGNVTRFNAASKNANNNKFILIMECGTGNDSDTFYFRLGNGSSLEHLSSITLYNYGTQSGSKNMTLNLFSGLISSQDRKIHYSK